MKHKKFFSALLIAALAFSLVINVTAATPPSHFRSTKTASNGGYIYTKPGQYSVVEGASTNIKGIPTTVKGVNVVRLNTNSFAKTKNVKSFTIPKYVKTIDNQVFYRASNSSFSVAKGNNSFATKDGILYSKDFKDLVAYPYNKKSTSYTMPDTVVSASRNAAIGNPNLKTVTLGKNLKTILNLSFFGSDNIKTLKVHKDNKYFKATDDMLLSKNGNELFYIAPKSSTVVVIPNKVTKVNNMVETKNVSVLAIPESMKDFYFLDPFDMPFILLKNKETFENAFSLFINIGNNFSYATLSGGNISSAKKDNDNNTIKLNIASLYYDQSYYEDPVWGERSMSSKEPWFMDKQFEIYRNNTKIATVDYRYDQDFVEFIDKNPSEGTNSYYVIPKFSMYGRYGDTVNVKAYQSDTVKVKF